MASLLASKTSYSLATVNQAPSSPPKMSINVRYLHEEQQQLQCRAVAELNSSIKLFFAMSKMFARS